MKRFLKNGLAISVSVVMLISCMGLGSLVAAPQIQILAPAGQNLVTNGNFEDPNSTAWAFGEGVSISSAAKRSGNYGLEMKSAVYDTRANFEFSQIALAPNTRYVVTADTCTNGLPLSCDFNVTGGEATVEKGTLTSSWTNVTILTIQTHTEYVFGKIAFEIYRDASATGNKAAYIDNVAMIATGNEWCPTPNGGMTMGTGIDEHFDSSTLKNGTLDKDVWLVSNTAWGGANGGLNSANVKLGTKDGRSVCILESHGDQYTGNVQGVGGNTTRVGSGIVTRDYYASARYTVVCKIEPVLGVCTAYWSFSYVGYMQDDTNGDGKADFYDQGDGLWEYNKLHNKDENGWIQENGVRNSEIDWETPSPMDDGGENDVVSHNNLRTNCWGGKRPGEGGNYSGRSHQNN
ncbi:MAG: hypothetical protein J6Z00_01720, partial [Clostridia bacterium]|nr:hypothetical protein [Clostridia bacterium]